LRPYLDLLEETLLAISSDEFNGCWWFIFLRLIAAIIHSSGFLSRLSMFRAFCMQILIAAQDIAVFAYLIEKNQQR